MSNSEVLKRQTVLAVVAAGLMSFAGIVVETAMNIAFPILMKEFSIGTADVQWVTTAYLLVLAIVIPLSSYFKRKFSTKSLFLTAIGIFTLGILIDLITPNFFLLIVGRGIQGIGTGLALPLMFNIILEEVPRSKRGFMIGVGTLITAVAPAIGPTYGGIILHGLSWRYIFVFLLPVLLISAILGAINIQASPHQASSNEKLDLLSVLYIAIAFSGIIYGFSRAGELGWTSKIVVGSLILGIISLILFVKRSQKITYPLLNLTVMKSAVFNWSLVCFVLLQMIVLGFAFLLPNYVQLVLGESAMTAGLLLMPASIIGAIFTPISGRLLDKFGAKKPIIFGSCSVIIALALFTGLSLNVVIIPFIYILYLVGHGSASGNTMTNGLNYLPKEQSADGNAIFNTVQQVAGAIGTAIVSTIVSTIQLSQPEKSFADLTGKGTHYAFIFLLVMALLNLLSVHQVFRSIQKEKNENCLEGQQAHNS